LASQAGLELDLELPARPFEAVGGIAIAPGGVELRSVNLGLAGARAQVEGVVATGPGLRGTDLSVEASGPDGSLVGRIAGVELPSEPFSARGRVVRKRAGVRFHASVAEVGEYRLELDGVLGELPRLVGTNLDLDARGPDLRLIGQFVELPRLPERDFEVTGHFDGDPEEFTLEDFSARLGQSDLAGTLRVDLRGKPRLEGELRSERFNLTPWLAAPRADDPAEGDAVAEAETPAEAARKTGERRGGGKGRSGKRRVIPDEPFDLAVLESLDGELRWSAGEILSRDRPLRDFELSARLQDGALHVDPVEAVGAFGGSTRARLILEPEDERYRVVLVLEGRDMRLLLAGRSEPEIRPVAQVEVQLRSFGRSFREIALNAEAWGVLTTGPGRLSNRGLDLLGMDLLNEIFMTLNPFAREDPYTNVECMLVAAIVKDGVARLSPLALRTSKTTLTGRGRIRFENEELDLSWTAKPRKGVGLASTTAITNPFLKVGGTLANPRIDVEPLRAATATGAAVATAGLSLLAQGMWDRVTSGKNVCKKARRDLLRWIEENPEVRSTVFLEE
jgi:uncharacterized protein involved in outer membrane biogenesis